MTVRPAWRRTQGDLRHGRGRESEIQPHELFLLRRQVRRPQFQIDRLAPGAEPQIARGERLSPLVHEAHLALVLGVGVEDRRRKLVGSRDGAALSRPEGARGRTPL